jgi:hypothetical protein
MQENARLELFMNITPYTVTGMLIENLLFGSDNVIFKVQHVQFDYKQPHMKYLFVLSYFFF